MCKAIEEMRNETARKTSLETAKSLLLIGKLTCEEIAQATKLTVEEVKELDGKKRAQVIDCLLAYCVVTTTSYVGRLFCFNTPEQQTEKLNSMKLSIKQSILFISIEKILLYSSNRQIKLMLKRQQVATTIWG